MIYLGYISAAVTLLATFIMGAMTYTAFMIERDRWQETLATIMCAFVTLGCFVAFVFTTHSLHTWSLRNMPDEPYRTEINRDNEAIFLGADAKRHEREYRAFREGMKAREEK